MEPGRLLQAALAAPLGSQAEGAMAAVVEVLSHCSLTIDPTVSTLAIGRHLDRWALQVNASFVHEQVQDQEDALFVLAHEAQHVLGEHFRLPAFPGVPPAVINVALDVAVNGALLRGLVTRSPGILARLYPLDRFPAVLLRPPTDVIACLADQDPDAKALRELAPGHFAAAVTSDPLVHARARALFTAHFTSIGGFEHPSAMARVYLDGWCEAQEPRSWVRRFLSALGRDALDPVWCQVPLLGGHGSVAQVGSSGCSMVVTWRHQREDLRLVTSTPPEVVRRRFVAAAHRALHPWISCISPDEAPPEQSIFPRVGRREQVLIAAGIPPQRYSHTACRPAQPDAQVHLYLDVSGSMERERVWYGPLARLLGERLAAPVWVWSGEVREASVADLTRGRFPSDGATHIEPVVDHALERRFRRVLIVTDGFFSFSMEFLAERIHRAGLEVIFLVLRGPRGGSQLESLRPIAREVMEVQC